MSETYKDSNVVKPSAVKHLIGYCAYFFLCFVMTMLGDYSLGGKKFGEAIVVISIIWFLVYFFPTIKYGYELIIVSDKKKYKKNHKVDWQLSLDTFKYNLIGSLLVGFGYFIILFSS